jgi:hypothetical protein
MALNGWIIFGTIEWILESLLDIGIISSIWLLLQITNGNLINICYGLIKRRKTSIANMSSIGSTNMVITTMEDVDVILGTRGQPIKRKEK